MGISWRSETKAHIGSHKAKTNAEYFSKPILTTVIEKDVPRLWKGNGENGSIRPPIMLPKTHVLFSTKVNYEAGMSWQLAWLQSPGLWHWCSLQSLMIGKRAQNLLRQTGVEQMRTSTVQKVLVACLKWVKAASKSKGYQTKRLLYFSINGGASKSKPSALAKVRRIKL